MRQVLVIFTFILTASISTCFADVKLPEIISDGIVLQRNAEIPVWGWADPDEPITLTFMGKEYKTRASSDGKWNISLPKMNPGGPFTMIISGKNRLEVKDILIGDVWLAAGQSNMVH